MKLSRLLRPLVGLVVGLFLGLMLALISGDSPLHVLGVIVKSAFGSKYDLGLTLFYATPLIFTGLSVAVAFHAGLFNIGAEGQLNVAALVTAFAAIMVPGLPPWLAPIFALFCGAGAGAVWGWIPGWLRTRRGSHEVINTIMLNFVAAALVSWAITGYLQNPDVQSPETAQIPDPYFLRLWDPLAAYFGDPPVSLAFPLAVLAAVGTWIFLWRTPWGFELRACGTNEDAAQAAGIDVARTRQWAFALAGALAGCVALGEVLGGSGRFRLGFSPDYGFIGIAVALLARSHPIGIIFSALLFGALHKGAADLDIETNHVTRDLSLVIQALVILCVSLAGTIQFRKRGGA
jgi:general nucleoside transport system permease protein